MRFVLFLASLPIIAQVNSGIRYVSTAPSGSCNANAQVRLKTPDGSLYTCQSGTWGVVSGGGGGAVSSVFGRTGAVVALTGDYTAAKVTNTVDTTSTYSNPGWITALAATKLTGTVPCAQLPALTGDITSTACATTIGAGKVVNSMIASATIDLVTKVTGILPVPNGGTGLATITSNAIPKGNGTSAMTISGITIDSSDNISTPGNLSTGVGTGVAGYHAFSQGTAPSLPAHSFSIYANSSIPTAFQWMSPTADSLGFIRSSGVGTPGALSIVGETGSGNVVRATSATLVTPALGVPSALDLTNATKIPITLTTTGSSGAASYTQNTNTLNIPQYSGGGGSGGLTMVETHTASTSASLDFTTCLTSTYDTYQIEIVNVIPATTQTNLWIRFSTNGGSSYDSTSIYDWAAWRASNGGSTGSGVTATSRIDLAANGSGTAIANWGYVGTVKLYDPLSTTTVKRLHSSVDAFDGAGGSSNPDVINIVGGTYASTTAVNAFQILSSSGNLTSGTVRCYGVPKS